MAFRGENTINGREGRLFLDGQEMAHIKVFKADAEKKKGEVPIMGNRWMSHKTAGVSGKGTMTFYKVTSQFVKMLLQYIRTGKDVYFTLQGVLDDPGADRGTERITLYNVNIDSATVSQLDADKESLEEEVPFTFEGMDDPETLRDDF
jgi:hypothetical protein